MKIGDKVEWTSQAGNRHKKKTGIIVEVVAPGQRPNRERFDSLYRGSGCGWGRKTESYVVNTGHPASSPKYYWPVQSLLRLVVSDQPKPTVENCESKPDLASAICSAPRYEIKTVQDFLTVPADRIEACLSEFRDYLEYARDIMELAKLAGEIVGAKETQTSVGSFNWCDDGIRKGTIHVETRVEQNKNQ